MKPLLQNLCLQCQNVYQTTRIKSKFCSLNCSATYSGSRRKLPKRIFPNRRNKIYKPCGICGKETPNKFFCSNKCRYENDAKNRKELFIGGKQKRRGIVYKFLVERDGNKCKECGLPGIWREKPLRLWVDHIDGNPSNDSPENFRLLCPNCESQTDTSRGKNYGKGRKSRGMPCYS
jgi:hypothetical protein